tara:strand:+ start:1294 stop:1608 length:315 start_codon:yes stop_codon:yes gene_type:complete
MINLNKNYDDFYDAAEFVEITYNIDLYKDIIFSNELNAYFNCDFNKSKNKITFSVEVDEGSAKFFINNFFNEDFDGEISCNSVAKKYLSRVNMDPIDFQNESYT